MFQKKGLILSLFAGLVTFLYSASAFAAEGGEYSAAAGYTALAACIGIGLAAFGGALGQSKAAASALEGIARNPGVAGKIMTPMIIALALIESLVIYAFVIAIIWTFK